MGDKPNPFDRKIKKNKLKAFGSGKRKGGVKTASPPKRVTPPARVVNKADNPFRQKAQRKKELADLESRITLAMAEYEKAFDVEAKLFTRLDKLKPGTNPYVMTQRKWQDAMRAVEKIQSRLLGMSAVRRKLKEKM